MRTTFFTPTKIGSTSHEGNKFFHKYEAATLEAYACTHVVGHFGALTSPMALTSIQGSEINFELEYDLDDLEFNLTVHYLGIRDYALLFPNVLDPSLKKRLGLFYEEMEVCFENGAWLTYMLMAGAVLEGFLQSKLDRTAIFKDLIDAAQSQNLITTSDRTLLHKVRNYRNLVHANLHITPYVDRLDAMNSRVLVDRLVRAT